MSAQPASIPLASSAIWRRLGLLAAALVAAFALAALVVAWLVPSNTPSRVVTYPLAALEVGVPAFYRPFDMGEDRAGRPFGIWLVRTEGGSVDAFWSRTVHPVDCGLTLRRLSQNEVAGQTLYGPALVERPFPLVYFTTPCLGSMFALDGTRLFGPAPRGLDGFPTQVGPGYVSIDTSGLILPPCSQSAWGPCSNSAETQTRRVRWPGPR